MIFLITLIGVSVYLATIEQFEIEKNPCKKWHGDINKSPSNICKDCGYPVDCHGPYKGESWRHIFREFPL
jgi:hypothetical protein